tara:strand:+ start:196 stop:483 length:288 start_codon:yes stop_codon:yes gene_type:complete
MQRSQSARKLSHDAGLAGRAVLVRKGDRRMMRAAARGGDMSQLDDIKEEVRAIQAGLKRLGANRVVALSVHVQKEVVAELEERAEKLMTALESME